MVSASGNPRRIREHAQGVVVERTKEIPKG